MPDAIHIHEDDWGMRNLYPLAAAPEVKLDLDEAISAGQRNLDPSGIGWTAVHMIQEPSQDYRPYELRLTDIAEKLAVIMPRVRKFAATIGAYVGTLETDPCGSHNDQAWCFGLDAQCFIKLEPDGEFVRAIWYEYKSNDKHAEQALRLAFEAIDRFVPSLLVDYWLDVQGALNDSAFIDRYFSMQEEQKIAAEDAPREYRRVDESKRPWWKRLFN